MKKKILFFTILFGFLACTSQKEPYKAVRQLIERNLDNQSSHFILDSIPVENGKDVFEISWVGNRIKISASSATAAASALNYYLKNEAHCLITQTSQQIHMPNPLPIPENTIHQTTPFTWRYYLNYCTFNYSMGSWGWNEWERQIDWMALNGINMPLAIIGTEAVWQNTLTRFGYSPDEARKFIAGPAYTAWWLMGNIEGWGGPVSQEWINNRALLQKKILQRMRDLGMTPVLQGFYSMVPATLKEKYPNHRIYPGGEWAYFERPATLDPTDSLFADMAAVYYQEMEKLYGTTLFYGGDPFHEGGNTDSINLTQSARQIQKAMQKAVPGSIWVLQGWWENPSDNLLKGIDPEKALILDLFAEGRPNWSRRECYAQYPWVWSMLQNFGNKTGLFGRLEMVCSEPFRALQSEKGHHMKGIGSMPEGIDNNPVMFDALFDMVWRNEAPEAETWIKKYVHYRYGQTNDSLALAWQILLKTVYRGPVNQEGTTDAIICARPSLDGSRSWNWGSTKIYYDTLQLQRALKLFWDAAPQLKTNDAFLYDLVDITRQVLVNRSKIIHTEWVKAYQEGDKEDLTIKSNEFLGLMYDLDKLLSTRKEFLFGPWIEGFKKMACSPEEKLLFEKNARMLVTVWGDDNGSRELHDYAMKQWSGLIKDFYAQRWEMYFSVLNQRLQGLKVPDPDFYSWEKTWTTSTNLYDTLPVDSTFTYSEICYKKYVTPNKSQISIIETYPDYPEKDFIVATLSYYTINEVTLEPSEFATSKIMQQKKTGENEVQIQLFIVTRDVPKHMGNIELTYLWNHYEWTLTNIKNIDFK